MHDRVSYCIYMESRTKIARYGNSLAVRIPRAIARDLDFREGDVVTVRSGELHLVVERAAKSRLEQRLETVSHLETEVVTGPARGNELDG